jgi:ribose 5-phosphate isomerase A
MSRMGDAIPLDTILAWKRAAARAAAEETPDGALIGLGTGSTAQLMLEALAERVRLGLRITGVPTSERARQAAVDLGIPVTTLDEVEELTLSIDGADEVTLPHLDLIKGRGGASLYEKLVATASRRRLIIVDATKLVDALGSAAPVPVEVIPFGWRQTAARIARLGGKPSLRTLGESSEVPYVTDGGHSVLDCHFGPIAQPANLAQLIKGTTGVVDHGLFVGMTERLYVGGPEGVRAYDRG